MPMACTIWGQLANSPLVIACRGAVAFGGCLLAVGEKDKKAAKRKSISLLPWYILAFCEWLHIADLPAVSLPSPYGFWWWRL